MVVTLEDGGRRRSDSGSDLGERRTGTVDGAVRRARERLTAVPTPRLDAELLLAHVLGRSRSWILAHPDAPLSPAEEEEFAALVDRRRRGEPVAYLRGYVEWYGMELEVTRDVLIPRPETELVLEKAVTLARETGARTLVDVGTGSGAISLGLAVSLPDVAVLATDVSETALAVARRNAARHGLADRIQFRRGDLLEALTGPPELVVANLPYLSDEMMDELGPDVRSEPRLALHGGASGLELYGDLLRQLDERRWSPSIVIEIDPRQADLIRVLWSGRHPEIERDYAGRERIVILRADR